MISIMLMIVMMTMTKMIINDDWYIDSYHDDVVCPVWAYMSSPLWWWWWCYQTDFNDYYDDEVGQTVWHCDNDDDEGGQLHSVSKMVKMMMLTRTMIDLPTTTMMTMMKVMMMTKVDTGQHVQDGPDGDDGDNDDEGGQHVQDGHDAHDDDDDDKGGQHVQDGFAQVPNGHTRVWGAQLYSSS